MSTAASLNRRLVVPRTPAWLMALLLAGLAIASCVPYQVYDPPTAAPQEINQHRRRARHARHRHVRQRQLPRSKPEWRQRYF